MCVDFQLFVFSYYAITEKVEALIRASNDGAQELHLSETVLDVSQRRNYVLSLAFYNRRGEVIDYFSIDNSRGALSQNPYAFAGPLYPLMNGKASYLWEYIPRHARSFMKYDSSPKLCLWHVVLDSSTQTPIGALAIMVDSRKIFPDQNLTPDLNDNVVIVDTRKCLAFGRSPVSDLLAGEDVGRAARQRQRRPHGGAAWHSHLRGHDSADPVPDYGFPHAAVQPVG